MHKEATTDGANNVDVNQVLCAEENQCHASVVTPVCCSL